MKENRETIAFESLPEAALLLDEAGTVRLANREATRALGRDLEELLGITLSVLLRPLHPGDRPEPFELKDIDEGQILLLEGPDGCGLFFDVSTSRLALSDEPAYLLLLRSGQQGAEDSDIFRRELAVDTWDIGLYEHDHLTQEIYGCQRVRALYGLTRDELLSVEVFVGALHPDDHDVALRAIMKAHDPEGSGDFDAFHRIRRPDGSTRWIHTRARTTFAFVNGKRAPLLTTGSIMDMTEHQELRLALERNEERLTQATIASEVGIFEVNHRPEPGEQSVFWSETLRNLVGVAEGSMPELDWFFSRVHADDRQKVAQAFRDSIDPNLRARYEVEHRFLAAEGRQLWLSARATTSFDDEGDASVPLRTTGAVLDVTERKTVEEDRRRRTAILDASPDFVAMTDLDGKFVYLNRSGREFLGIGLAESLDNRTIGSAHPLESKQFIEEVGLPAARKRGSWTAETQFIRHDGVVVPMSQVIQVHRDESDQVVYYSTVCRDLSRERELEQQFRQAQKMDAVGRLAGGVAHDFNNLLSVIMGFAEIAGNRVQKGMSAQKELLEIQKAAGRAAALTGQLLAFSRKQILSPQAIDVNETVVGTMPMLKRLLGENIELVIEPTRQAAQTKADPHQVEQVLMNLAVNARDAMPGGGRLSITVSRVRLEQPTDLARLDLEKGKYVVIAVSDSGHGMNAQTREKIFEPFFTTKEQGKGTGLGLSTVFGIVRQSGGGISVSSEPDQGTSFRVYFPSTEERVQPPPAPGPLRSESVGGVILVTEDEAQLRRMVVLVLTQAGYTVIGAGDPEEALRLSRQYEGEIDLLLTDVVMPIMSGKELADRLAKERPTTQVIFMSGYTEDSIVEQGVLDESVNFIPKPITPQILLTAVANVLRKVTLDQ